MLDEPRIASGIRRSMASSGFIDLRRLTTSIGRPEAIDASDLKLRILDRFYKLAEQWHLPVAPPLGPIAPFSPRHFRSMIRSFCYKTLHARGRLRFRR